MYTNAPLFVYMAGLLVAGLFYALIRSGGPWNRRSVKVRIRVRDGRRKLEPAGEDENTAFEPADWVILGIFMVLFVVGVAGYS